MRIYIQLTQQQSSQMCISGYMHDRCRLGQGFQLGVLVHFFSFTSHHHSTSTHLSLSAFIAQETLILSRPHSSLLINKVTTYTMVLTTYCVLFLVFHILRQLLHCLCIMSDAILWIRDSYGLVLLRACIDSLFIGHWVITSVIIYCYNLDIIQSSITLFSLRALDLYWSYSSHTWGMLFFLL